MSSDAKTLDNGGVTASLSTEPPGVDSSPSLLYRQLLERLEIVETKLEQVTGRSKANDSETDSISSRGDRQAESYEGWSQTFDIEREIIYTSYDSWNKETSLVHFEKEFKQRLKEQDEQYKILKTEFSSELSSSPVVNEEELSAVLKEVEPQRATSIKQQLYHNDLKDIMDVRQQIETGELMEISFEHLCYLFEPGQELISSKLKDQLYRVLHVCGGRRLFKKSKAFEAKPEENRLYDTRAKIFNFIVDAFHVDFDGKKFRAAPRQLIITPYDGLRKLSLLEVFPLRFHHSKERIEDDLMLRGEKFVKAINDMHERYRGLSINEGGSYGRQVDVRAPASSPGDVIVDFELAIRSDPSIELPRFDGSVIKNPTEASKREIIEAIQIEEVRYEDDGFVGNLLRSAFVNETELLDSQPICQLSKDRLKLLTYRVYGFVLLDRKWLPLDIDMVVDVDKVQDGKTDGFSELVLPPRYKDIVRAMINTHARAQLRNSNFKSGSHALACEIDLVKGKGKGLIILLHGAPGVGKTFTAECVVANTGRPLFPITCGDIGGTSVADMEQSLEKYFDLARRWGCVLLLDEADVFLGERIKGDIKQNSLVSVFLRVLEYYSGILILVTNRVGDFDEAVKSRIHCTLYYPPLDKDNTKHVWKMNLNRLAQNNQEGASYIEFDKHELVEFAKWHWKAGHRWNGRQIRNAFQTAIALAEWDNMKMNKRSPNSMKSDASRAKIGTFRNDHDSGQAAALDISGSSNISTLEMTKSDAYRKRVSLPVDNTNKKNNDEDSAVNLNSDTELDTDQEMQIVLRKREEKKLLQLKTKNSRKEHKLAPTKNRADQRLLTTDKRGHERYQDEPVGAGSASSSDSS
ncbi:MAG: hypothetical protein Q9167_007355 [Letrouitia subvulpina]